MIHHSRVDRLAQLAQAVLRKPSARLVRGRITASLAVHGGVYSARSTTIGSIAAARRAGT